MEMSVCRAADVYSGANCRHKEVAGYIHVGRISAREKMVVMWLRLSCPAV